MRTRYLGGVTGVSAAAILGAACGPVLAQSIAELMAIIRTQRQIEALSRRPSLRLDRKDRPTADYPQLAVEGVLSGASLIPGAEALDSRARRRRLHWTASKIALRESRQPLLTLLAINNTARLRPRCFRFREGNPKL
jgi:hypothetical protein